MEAKMNSSTTGTGTFSATDLRRRMAEHEAAKAAEDAKRLEEQEARQKAVIEEFHKPPARTPEQLMTLVMHLVDRAAERGESEVQVYQFPSFLCADKGRAINNFESEWHKTLSGRPQLAYEFWEANLKPLGFGLKAQILDYPGGFPGEVGFFLMW
jgi:hypothetical protein